MHIPKAALDTECLSATVALSIKHAAASSPRGTRAALTYTATFDVTYASTSCAVPPAGVEKSKSFILPYVLVTKNIREVTMIIDGT